ncbi:MAG: hypothetical protein M0R16_01840 [Bacteroidales bacterium]|jgi:hypothetical protein|nr:hypothetical protein [Bacteroidales bacterium]
MLSDYKSEYNGEVETVSTRFFKIKNGEESEFFPSCCNFYEKYNRNGTYNELNYYVDDKQNFNSKKYDYSSDKITINIYNNQKEFLQTNIYFTEKFGEFCFLEKIFINDELSVLKISETNNFRILLKEDCIYLKLQKHNYSLVNKVDNSGKIVQSILKHASGIRVEKYYFNNDILVKKETFKGSEIENDFPSEIEEYIYNSAGKLIKEKVTYSLITDNNLQEIMYQIRYKYDKKGNWIEKREYGANKLIEKSIRKITYFS